MGRMRKAAALLLALLAACGGPASSGGLDEPAEENKSLSASSASEPLPEEETPEGYYPYTLSGQYPLPMSGRWEPDGSFTFQNENTICTLTPDNELAETVVLPLEELPPDYFTLTWSGSYILAFAGGDRGAGEVYLTEDGKVQLSDVSLFDRQGKLVRQYPPVPYGAEAVKLTGLINEGSRAVYWLDDETVVICVRSYVILYDFAADAGQVLEDMSALVDAHGESGVNYGVKTWDCGVMDGGFYYITRLTEEESVYGGTVRRADKNGVAELFGGKKFFHLSVGKNAVAMAESIVDPVTAQGGSRVCYAVPGSDELREIWRGRECPDLPFQQSESYIILQEFDKEAVDHHWATHLCRIDTGEVASYHLGDAWKLRLREGSGSPWLYYTLFQDNTSADWVYDTAAGTAARLPEGSVMSILSVSPDGSHIIRKSGEDEPPLLRMTPWPS